MRVEMERNVPVAADRKEIIYPGASPRPVGKPSRQPETGSLNAILREHSRERLYVRTIAWTGRQVRMLNMAFEKTDADATTQGTHQKPDDEGGGCLDGEQPNANEYRCMKSNTVRTIKAIETLMKECVEKQVGECAEMQKAAMRTLLAEFGFKSAGKGSVGEHGFRYVDKNGLTKAGRAEFQFGKKTVDTVRPDAVFETNSRGLQLVAYAYFETISNSRKRYSRGKAKKLQRISRQMRGKTRTSPAC
ncbi:hypothetical protein EsHS_00002422 [Epichloe bromicola]